ncbi:phosphoglycerate kinase [Candidatus Woesearchaeota archaeon]|nr:phosphoglycerate kinase [Candidatus Woesearchaeota archaeon]
MPEFKTLKDFDIKDKRVLVRCDFNVPLDDKEEHIDDDWKIRKSLPTIQYLLDKGAKQIVLMSHLGRPKGEIVDNLKMNKVADRLAELLGQPILKLNDCIDEEAPEDERIILLENLRFHSAEKDSNEHFAKALSEYGEIFVNDAFGTCHRAHASVVGVPKFLPSCAGLLLEDEIKHLSSVVDPERPACAILGFAKIASKFGMMRKLFEKLDFVLMGGAVVFTFLKAKGFEVGKSKVEEDDIQLAKDLMIDFEDKIIFPSDFVVADRMEEGAKTKTVGIADFPIDKMGLDIGPESVSFFIEKLSEAKTVVWNGPLGVFEIEEFSNGTREIAEYLADADKTVVIGGGETSEAIRKFKLDSKMTWVSTGGGASMDYLEDKELPGITALEENTLRF